MSAHADSPESAVGSLRSVATSLAVSASAGLAAAFVWFRFSSRCPPSGTSPANADPLETWPISAAGCGVANTTTGWSTVGMHRIAGWISLALPRTVGRSGVRRAPAALLWATPSRPKNAADTLAASAVSDFIGIIAGDPSGESGSDAERFCAGASGLLSSERAGGDTGMAVVMAGTAAADASLRKARMTSTRFPGSTAVESTTRTASGDRSALACGIGAGDVETPISWACGLLVSRSSAAEAGGGVEGAEEKTAFAGGMIEIGCPASQVAPDVRAAAAWGIASAGISASIAGICESGVTALACALSARLAERRMGVAL